MTEHGVELAAFISLTLRRMVIEADTTTEYREPLVGFASADDTRFSLLPCAVQQGHMLPGDLLPGARSVVSFFLPFARWVVEANASQPVQVAREWAVAYTETNALIGCIAGGLTEALAERGIRAASQPATHNFDPDTLASRWSHKSVALVAGLGSFGLHNMLITDAGCAGRFGSLVVDAALPASQGELSERCLYFHDGSCLECVTRCPVAALDATEPMNKQLCWERCKEVAKGFEDLGLVDVCGKCAVGPCSFGPAVQP